MKKFVVFFMLFCVLITSSACTLFQSGQDLDNTVDMTPRLISASGNLSSSEVVENVRSAIVGISASLSYGTSIGSGVAIADGGYVLTNEHVVDGAGRITLYFADKTQGTAKLIWSDTSLDLAIVKSAKNMPYLNTAPLSDVSVGEDVLAVGTPISLQFQHTVTKGIVSALNRTLEIQNLNGLTTYMQNLIQHDASINSGNSGGPLINSSGKVIGINSLKASDAEGIGFAIPIETATTVVDKIIPLGAFKQAYVGIFGCDAELAKYKEETDFDSGVFIVDIAMNSPVASSEIKVGDVIVGVNGKNIKNMLDFRKAIYNLNSGENVSIEYYSNNKKFVETVIAE